MTTHTTVAQENIPAPGRQAQDLLSLVAHPAGSLAMMRWPFQVWEAWRTACR